jgi:hypothetical protein
MTQGPIPIPKPLSGAWWEPINRSPGAQEALPKREPLVNHEQTSWLNLLKFRVNWEMVFAPWLALFVILGIGGVLWLMLKSPDFQKLGSRAAETASPTLPVTTQSKAAQPFLDPYLRDRISQAILYVSVFVAGLVIYFAPALVAKRRRHRNLFAITVLNLFAGWTFVGWVVALLWAVKEDNRGPPASGEWVEQGRFARKITRPTYQFIFVLAGTVVFWLLPDWPLRWVLYVCPDPLLNRFSGWPRLVFFSVLPSVYWYFPSMLIYLMVQMIRQRVAGAFGTSGAFSWRRHVIIFGVAVVSVGTYQVVGTYWRAHREFVASNQSHPLLHPIEGAFGLKLGQPTNNLELTFGWSSPYEDHVADPDYEIVHEAEIGAEFPAVGIRVPFSTNAVSAIIARSDRAFADLYKILRTLTDKYGTPERPTSEKAVWGRGTRATITLQRRYMEGDIILCYSDPLLEDIREEDINNRRLDSERQKSQRLKKEL